MAGKALHGAALALRRILLDTAAALTGMPAGDCTLERDGVRAGGRLLGFAELIAAAPAEHRRGDGLAADGSEFGEHALPGVQRARLPGRRRHPHR